MDVCGWRDGTSGGAARPGGGGGHYNCMSGAQEDTSIAVDVEIGDGQMPLGGGVPGADSIRVELNVTCTDKHGTHKGGGGGWQHRYRDGNRQWTGRQR